MKTILVLAEHPGSAEAIRSALNPEQFRVVHRTSLEEAEPLLAHGLACLCVLDIELTGIQAIWLIEKTRRRAPQCPIVVVTDARQGEWEEEAYLQGVTQVIAKPLRPRLLQLLVERLVESGVTSTSGPTQPPSGTEFLSLSASQRATGYGEPAPSAGRAPDFEILRKFSGILTHSLHAEALLKQFILLLREMFSINRAAVFLRQPITTFGDLQGVEASRRLRPVCSLGIAPGLLEHFELSLDAGTGAQLFRSGRILRRSSEETLRDAETRKEFELLGVQVAVPILDRETLVGVALFDGRITGELLVNAELELIFHLLEQLGLAVRNIWLHDQLSGNHALLAEILRELSSACVVVGPDLVVLHANKAARRLFGGATHRSGELQFSDLPQALGSKAYQVLKTGAALPTFRYEPDSPTQTVLYVSVVPFHTGDPSQPTSALLMAEDRTQAEQLQQLEIEAANLRLVKTMADRMAHEIGNALVPLSTHQQLLSEKFRDPEFRTSLSDALADGVKRISRLINQMRYLARDSVLSPESMSLATLVEEAYQEAQKYHPVRASQLRYEDAGKPVVVNGDRAALKHALTEVIINALQANPSSPKIGVRLCGETNGTGAAALGIEVQDNGSGFSPEALQKASSPFYTTRNVGLGLGLAVTRKIVETHRGHLEIIGPPSVKSGLVRISLPLTTAPEPEA